MEEAGSSVEGRYERADGVAGISGPPDDKVFGRVVGTPPSCGFPTYAGGVNSSSDPVVQQRPIPREVRHRSRTRRREVL